MQHGVPTSNVLAKQRHSGCFDAAIPSLRKRFVHWLLCTSGCLRAMCLAVSDDLFLDQHCRYGTVSRRDRSMDLLVYLPNLQPVGQDPGCGGFINKLMQEPTALPWSCSRRLS